MAAAVRWAAGPRGARPSSWRWSSARPVPACTSTTTGRARLSRARGWQTAWAASATTPTATNTTSAAASASSRPGCGLVSQVLPTCARSNPPAVPRSRDRRSACIPLPWPAGTARTLNCGASQAATRPGFELWPARAETSISAATARSPAPSRRRGSPTNPSFAKFCSTAKTPTSWWRARGLRLTAPTDSSASTLNSATR